MSDLQEQLKNKVSSVKQYRPIRPTRIFLANGTEFKMVGGVFTPIKTEEKELCEYYTQIKRLVVVT